MFIGRNCQTVVRQVIKLRQLFVFPLEQQLLHQLVKALCPIIVLTVHRIKVDPRQIMHQVAAAHDEYPFLPQGGQGPPQRVMFSRGKIDIQAQFQDRDIGRRNHMLQHRPSRMVDSPRAVRQYTILAYLPDPLGNRG